MIEYEIKYRANRFMLSEVIEDLVFVGKKKQNDIYYDTPDYILFLNAVFLRKRNNETIDAKFNFDKTDISHLFCNETSLKLPLSKDTKNKLEFFLSQLIQPIENEDKIFKKYQLKEFVVINKSRETYQNNDIEVSFDIVENLGEFIEIEAKTDKGIIDIEKFMHNRNIQRITTGYVELLLNKYNNNLYKKGKYLTK